MQGPKVITEEFVEAVELLDRDGFSLEGMLGRGGVGVVFAAERASGEAVAVKLAWAWREEDPPMEDPGRPAHRVRVPRPADSRHPMRYVCPTAQALCNRAVAGEYRRLAELRDEAVVRVFEVLPPSQRSGYAMARVDGDELELVPGATLGALGRVVQRLHAGQWPHGDLKPGNVRVLEAGRVCLIDPLAIGSELVTPEWAHLNFLVSTPLVDSADPRDRRAVYRHRDLVALALMVTQAFAGERPWGHGEVTRMLDRAVTPEAKREELSIARDRLGRILERLPVLLRPFVSIALEPGLWPEEGPAFAAYLQARPFETRCEALTSMDAGRLLAECCD